MCSGDDSVKQRGTRPGLLQEEFPKFGIPFLMSGGSNFRQCSTQVVSHVIDRSEVERHYNPQMVNPVETKLTQILVDSSGREGKSRAIGISLPQQRYLACEWW